MRSFKVALLGLIALIAIAGAPVHAISSVAAVQKMEKITLISVAHADEAQPAVSPSPSQAAPVAQSGVAKAGSLLDDLASKIPLSGVVITVLAFIYDLVRRKFPTKDAAGLLHDLSALFKGVASIFTKLGGLLDAVLGQNIQQ